MVLPLLAAASIAAGTVSAIGQYNQSKSEARAAARAGNIAAQKRGLEIQRLAARQRNAYLNAGFELEGTPRAVIQDTYDIGRADLKDIYSTYDKKSSNLILEGRMNFLSNMLEVGAKGFSSWGVSPNQDYSTFTSNVPTDYSGSRI